MKLRIVYLCTLLGVLMACKQNNVNTDVIRGVWLTYAASDALSSPENIKTSMRTIREHHFNTVYVTVYAENKTLWDSAVLRANTPDKYPVRKYDFDALAVAIKEAHKNGLKIYAWFEYGFGSAISGQRSPILEKHPDWTGVAFDGATEDISISDGAITLHWSFLSPYHPSVQQYMLDLMAELVTKYTVDGVQVDDRLPAAPESLGYNSVVKSLYQKDTGLQPPLDYKNEEWRKWRINNLNQFMKRSAETLRAIRPGIIISSSPHPYKWGYQHFMQDYPTWLKEGWVDFVAPQLYRNESQGITSYTNVLDDDLAHLPANFPRKNFSPGLLIGIGLDTNSPYMASKEWLSAMIAENRKRGIEGESWFFYEAMKQAPYRYER